MEKELITLKTTVGFREKSTVSNSKLVIDKFIEACLHLDASIFEPFMNEDDVFQEKDKYRFLAELYRIFDDYEHATVGDFYVDRKTTICNGCNKGNTVAHFSVYNGTSGEYVGEFGFGFEFKGNILSDISRCHRFIGGKFDTLVTESLRESMHTNKKGK